MRVEGIQGVGRDKVKSFIRWLRLALLAAPLSIILHEGGHALTAMSVGFSGVYITFHSWGGRAPLNIEPWGRAMVCAGGPIASFLIVVVCYLMVRLRHNWDFPRALGMMAPVQFTGALIYVLGSVLGINAPTVFDSARVAYHLGTSIFITSIPGSVVLLTAWVFFIRSMDADNRVVTVLSVILGGVIGFILWLTLLGPLVLPE